MSTSDGKIIASEWFSHFNSFLQNNKPNSLVTWVLPQLLFLPVTIIFLKVQNFPLDLGAAYGTAKSGVGISSMGVLKPDLIFKSIVPVIMAGILGIYGLIICVILSGKGKLSILLILDFYLVGGDKYDYATGYKHLASGLVCGLSSLVISLLVF